MNKINKILPNTFGRFKAGSQNDYVKYAEEWAKQVEESGDYTEPEPDDYIPPVDFPKFPRHLNEFYPKNSKSEDWNKTYAQIKNVIIPKGATCVLCGGRGTGKSQMGVCLVKHSCLKGKSALYETSLEINAALKTHFNNRKFYLSPFLLVIDAFEVRYNTNFEDCSLNSIIDKRYSDNKSTLIITNDKEEEFGEALGPSIYDRVIETGFTFRANWGSMRKSKI